MRTTDQTGEEKLIAIAGLRGSRDRSLAPCAIRSDLHVHGVGGLQRGESATRWGPDGRDRRSAEGCRYHSLRIFAAADRARAITHLALGSACLALRSPAPALRAFERLLQHRHKADVGQTYSNRYSNRPSRSRSRQMLQFFDELDARLLASVEIGAERLGTRDSVDPPPLLRHSVGALPYPDARTESDPSSVPTVSTSRTDARPATFISSGRRPRHSHASARSHRARERARRSRVEAARGDDSNLR